MPSKRDIVVIVSDSHGGSKNGLLNPSVELYEEINGVQTAYTLKPNPIQEYLWEIYTNAIDEISKLAGKSPVHLIHNGDITQGTKRPKELVSTRMADHILIGGANLVPWYEYIRTLKTVRLVKGTGSHEFEEGSSSLVITSVLQKEYKKIDTRCLYHGWANIGEFTIDFAHHGASVGTRNWLRGNELRYYTRSIMLDEITNGCRPPDLVVRSHYHQYVEEDVRVGKFYTKAVVTPSMCWIDDFGTQAAKSPSRVSNGVIAVEIVDGKIMQIIPFMKTADLRTREVW